MKTKKSDISLRELFREKLEFAEITPDAALKEKLMRRVARIEFLQFNPGRFNIFYLGGIIGVILTASALIFSGSGSNEKLNLQDLQKINHSDTTGFLEVAIDKPLTVTGKIQEPTFTKKTVAGIPFKNETDTGKSDGSNKVVVTAPGRIEHSISKNGLFPDAKTEGKMLKGRVESANFSIFPSSYSGCAPLKVQFKNTSESFDSCIWTFGDGGFSDKKDPEWIYDVAGDYKVDLQVFRDGKLMSSAATVTVHPRPKAHFEISPVKTGLSNEEIRFLNYSTNAGRFRWDFGDGAESDNFEPVHNYSGSGNYNVRLIVYSEWGCADSLTVYNAFSGSEYFIEFPNAFIPNEQGPSGGYYSSKSDEAAQVFHPSFTGVTEYQLKIFSKLGIPIFESNDINLGWDGYNKDQLCEAGVYIWKVRGKFRNGEPFIQMGDVTLLRNQ